MENVKTDSTNVLLTLPNQLNEKLQSEARGQQRKRHAQIIYILEKFFETAGGNRRKEKSK